METVLIPLNKGLFAAVDAQDAPLVSTYRWHARFSKGGRPYAGTRPIGSKRTILMHRLLMGHPNGLEVDHRNGDTLDNHKSNLRVCGRIENARNQVVKNREKSSRFKGVSWKARDKRWIMQICIDGGKRLNVAFPLENDAARAYDVAALKHHGEFARTNKMLGLL